MATDPAALHTMDVRLLGPLEVRLVGAEGDPVVLGGPRQRTLFGLLALRSPDVVSRSQLVDGIWDERPPASATKTLHAHVAYLRRSLAAAGLGDSIVTRAAGYALRGGTGRLDTHRFAELVQTGRAALRTGAPQRAAGALRSAVGLWRGDVLADCPLGAWAQAEVAALHETRLYATEDLQAAQVALGDYGPAVSELEALVAREPLRERLWELLMLALFRSGRTGDALRAYQRARTALADNLGIEPGAALRRLELAILAGQEPDPRALNEPRPRVEAGQRSSGSGLPAPLTALIGRHTEIEQVCAEFDRRRLVTLCGVGGCGKTRLALGVAEALAAGYADGVRFVDLTAVADPAAVAGAVAAALGIRERPDLGPLELLTRQLHASRLLLVLDNCEHLIDAAADLASALLGRCPSLHVLATSREPLGIPGELAWPVPPLSVPAGVDAGGLADLRRHDSVRLFLDRAAVATVRALVDADAPALAAICAGVDGLPLALELAAARTHVLTVQEIADRIHEPALLRAAHVGSRPQHGALDATMDWSYGLLDPGARARFRQLAVFTGGFTLDAAQALWPDAGDRALEMLAELVAKSLVVMEPRRPAARYRMLATIRHYAWQRLSESPDEMRDARQAHAAYYGGVAAAADGNLSGADVDRVLDQLALEQANLLAAMAWYAEHGPAGDELRLATSLARFCHLRGRYRDGRRWLERAISHHAGTPGADLARALSRAAFLAFFECDYAAATEHGELALAINRDLGDTAATAPALSLLAAVDRERGHYDRSAERYRAAASASREAGDDPGLTQILLMTAFTAWLAGDLDEAERVAGEALLRFQAADDPEGIASARVHLGAIAHYRGQPDRARWLAQDALARFRRLEFNEGIAWALNVVGLIEHRHGEPRKAWAALRGSLELHGALGDRWRTASVLDALAAVLVQADPDAGPPVAAELAAAASAIRAALGVSVPAQERADREATLAAARRALGDAAFYACWARGEGIGMAALQARLADLVLPADDSDRGCAAVG
jgi:predicted ATPase/DNA-binding SARP family transcriptional activator